MAGLPADDAKSSSDEQTVDSDTSPLSINAATDAPSGLILATDLKADTSAHGFKSRLLAAQKFDPDIRSLVPISCRAGVNIFTAFLSTYLTPIAPDVIVKHGVHMASSW